MLKDKLALLPGDSSASLRNLRPTNLKYDARQTLLKNGIYITEKLGKTLQGSIYKGILIQKNKNIQVVIKRADKLLSKLGYAKIKTQKHTEIRQNIDENIEKEAAILIYLQKKNPPNGFLNLYKFISDERNYFMITNYCGISLFNHIKKYHEKILKKEILINEWCKHIKIIFRQLINIVYWLHNNNITHLDISCENITINNIIYKNGKFINNGQIYLIDYGLAEYWNNDNFICDKRGGKILYQSPEIRNKNKNYDPRLADVWALGIVLFMMLIGRTPINVASINDPCYVKIINGYLGEMIIDYPCINSANLDLLKHILCNVNKRFHTKDIIKHTYLNF